MKDNEHEELLTTVKRVGDWLRSTGYTEDVSPICTGLYDLYEGVMRMHQEFVPSLLKLDGSSPSDYDKAGQLLMDLLLEFDHLRRHCEDAKSCLDPVVKHIEAIEGEFNV